MSIDATSRTLAIIPARGGSKGVPRKNLVEVAGEPLIFWTIQAVAQARRPIRCVVSTDDDGIASIARAAGAEVIDRPSDLSTDESPTEPALLHTLDVLERAYGYNPSEVVLLQPTSPVRRPGSIDHAIELLHSRQVDSVISVVDQSPFLWRGPLEAPKALYSTTNRLRRQDLRDEDRCYRENGSIYVTTRQSLVSTQNRVGQECALFLMSPEEGIDIDTPADLIEAGSILRNLFPGTRE